MRIAQLVIQGYGPVDIQSFNMARDSCVREFPGKSGWETAAVGILLSYEKACSENPNNCDLLKYGVMHAFRWGGSTNSTPILEPNAPLSDAFLQDCTSIRRLGNEFVGVFGCHKRHMAGVFHLEKSQDDHLRFAAIQTGLRSNISTRFSRSETYQLTQKPKACPRGCSGRS